MGKKSSPRKDLRRRQSVMIAVHEWVEIVMDAKSYGLSPSQFLVLMWRNWRSSRASLAVIPELPVDPWEQKKAG